MLLSCLLTVICALSVTFAQTNNVCLWGRSDFNAQIINGLWVYQGTFNAAPYYRHDIDASWNSATPTYLWRHTDNQYYITATTPTSSLSSFYASCLTSSANPWTCGSNWRVGAEPSADPAILAYQDSCPEWDCDAIVTTDVGNGCDQNFNVQVASNVWRNAAGDRYWYFQIPAFFWVCSTTYTNASISYHAYTDDVWYDVSKPDDISLNFAFPSTAPTSHPIQCIANPSSYPTQGPTASPTNAPSAAPTPGPSPAPTLAPSAAPSYPPGFPTQAPTREPTKFPSQIPTKSPTVAAPTEFPTKPPTKSPSLIPTQSPTASIPGPTRSPSETPTTSPSNNPSVFPSSGPTRSPSQNPTQSPLVPDAPTSSPLTPTLAPSNVPSTYPTPSPSVSPTELPSSSPIETATAAPSDSPSATPSQSPTAVPTTLPSASPIATEWEPCIEEFVLSTVGDANGERDQGVLSIDIDATLRKLRIGLIGPSAKWFGIGFGSQVMSNTFAITVSGQSSADIVQRVLENHAPGSSLGAIADATATDDGSNVNVTVVLDWNDVFDFTDFLLCNNLERLPIIWARGMNAIFGYHGSQNTNNALELVSCACDDIDVTTTTATVPSPTAAPTEDILGDTATLTRLQLSWTLIMIFSSIYFSI